MENIELKIRNDFYAKYLQKCKSCTEMVFKNVDYCDTCYSKSLTELKNKHLNKLKPILSEIELLEIEIRELEDGNYLNSTCASCGEISEKRDIINGEVICENCRNSVKLKVINCNGCGEKLTNSNISDDPEIICNLCSNLRKFTIPCKRCEKQIEISEINKYPNQLCRICFENTTGITFCHGCKSPFKFLFGEKYCRRCKN